MRSSERREIIFAEDEPSIRRVLWVLFGEERCVARIAQGGEDFFAMITRDKFDAILLDLQPVSQPGYETQGQIMSVNPILVGRVLVVTAEAANPEIVQNMIRDSVPRSLATGFLSDLWHRFRALMSPSTPHKASR